MRHNRNTFNACGQSYPLSISIVFFVACIAVAVTVGALHILKNLRTDRIVTIVERAGGYVETGNTYFPPIIARFAPKSRFISEVHLESFPSMGIALNSSSSQRWSSLQHGKPVVDPVVIDSLVKSTSPELFYVDFANISDLEIARLSSVGSIRCFGIAGTRCTNNGFKHIRIMRNLSELRCSYLNIDDSVVDDLLQLRELVHLDVSHTGISAEGVLRLAKLPRLRTLVAIGNELPGEGIDGFSQIFPNVSLVTEGFCSTLPDLTQPEATDPSSDVRYISGLIRE